MSDSRSRSSSLRDEDEELRLPRPPGLIRRFWARHPVVADVVIALVCLLLSAAPPTVLEDAPGYEEPLVPPPSGGYVVTGLVVLACLLLLRRRQWPVIAFIAAYGVAFAALLLEAPTGGILLLATSYAVAVYRSARDAWIGLITGIALYSMTSLAMYATSLLTLQMTVNGILGQLTVTLIGTLVGVNVGGRKRYLEAVIGRSRQLLIERDQQAQIAAAAERARIAREMHDIVSHSLTVVVALSEGAAATDDRTQARTASVAAAETARGALTEMRSMLGVLRDGGAEVPLAPVEPVDPAATVAAAQRAGYPITLTVSGEAAVDTATGHAIGRIVQEGVTNAMRHAPSASAITVRIIRSPVHVVVEVDNDGVVAPAGASGFGLRGLHERAAHVGGTLVSRPVGAGRWSLRAELPAHAERAPHPEASTELREGDT